MIKCLLIKLLFEGSIRWLSLKGVVIKTKTNWTWFDIFAFVNISRLLNICWTNRQIVKYTNGEETDEFRPKAENISNQQ